MKKHVKENRTTSSIFKNAIICSKIGNGRKRWYFFNKKILSYKLRTKISYDKETILIVDHSLGGGANLYTERYIFEKRKTYQIVRLQYIHQLKKFKLTINNSVDDRQPLIEYFSSIKEIDLVINSVKLKKIVLNNLVGYPDSLSVISFIKKIKKSFDCELIMKLHDYHCVCPTFVMINSNGDYCNARANTNCQECIAKYSWSEDPYTNNILRSGFHDIKSWRNAWGDLLERYADVIDVFSKSSQDILTRFYSVENKIRFRPHKVPCLPKIEPRYHNGINIGILGGLTQYHKGLSIIEKMLMQDDLICELQFVVFGESNLKGKGIKVKGQYTHKDLPKLVYEENIDAFFIPSIWPETFSYTTSEAIMMGLPVISYNLGAQSEKIKSLENGLVLEKIDPRENLIRIINFLS